jgi:drug/metabolite transporter (DMT)-like permease
MLAGSLSFALMGELTHGLRSSCDWSVIALARSGFATAAAVAVTLATGKRLVFFKPRVLWVRSTAGSLSLLATFFALTRLPVSDVLTLTNTFPLWVAVISWRLLDERPPSGIWLAVASGLLGVGLIQQPQLAQGNLVALAALGASVATAVAMLGLHRLGRIDPWAIVAHFGAVSVGLCTAVLLLSGRAASLPAALEPSTLLALLGVGATATVGQFFLTKAFVAGPPTRVSVVGLSQVVVAMGLDAVLGFRPFGALTLLGTALVLAPTAWVMARRG